MPGGLAAEKDSDKPPRWSGPLPNPFREQSRRRYTMLRRALSATHVEQLKPSSGTCRLLPKRLGKHSKCGAHFSDEDIRANNTVGACLFAF